MRTRRRGSIQSYKERRMRRRNRRYETLGNNLNVELSKNDLIKILNGMGFDTIDFGNNNVDNAFIQQIGIEKDLYPYQIKLLDDMAKGICLDTENNFYIDTDNAKDRGISIDAFPSLEEVMKKGIENYKDSRIQEIVPNEKEDECATESYLVINTKFEYVYKDDKEYFDIAIQLLSSISIIKNNIIKALLDPSDDKELSSLYLKNIQNLAELLKLVEDIVPYTPKVNRQNIRIDALRKYLDIITESTLPIYLKHYERNVYVIRHIKEVISELPESIVQLSLLSNLREKNKGEMR